MTADEFARICEWDRKCGDNEGTMFQTTVDRRRLIEYVKELQVELEKFKQGYYFVKEGDKARSKTTQFTGTVGGMQTRIVDGVTVIERVLIIAERRPGARMWCDMADVEILDGQ